MGDTPLPTRCLTVAQVAELLGHHPSHVYRLIEDGDLPAVRVGRRGLSVTVPDYEAFLEANRTPVPAPPAGQLRSVS